MLILAIDRRNELALPGTQSQLHTRMLPRGNLEILSESVHPAGPGEPGRIPRVGARGCRFERRAPRHQWFSTWSSKAHARNLPYIGVSAVQSHQNCDKSRRFDANPTSPTANLPDT